MNRVTLSIPNRTFLRSLGAAVELALEVDLLCDLGSRHSLGARVNVQ